MLYATRKIPIGELFRVHQRKRSRPKDDGSATARNTLEADDVAERCRRSYFILEGNRFFPSETRDVRALNVEFDRRGWGLSRRGGGGEGGGRLRRRILRYRLDVLLLAIITVCRGRQTSTLI